MGSAMKMLATTFGEWEEFADDWYASKSKSKSKAGSQAGYFAVLCSTEQEMDTHTHWLRSRARMLSGDRQARTR
eukprot:COSAG06_NODE_1642_length_8827_cov_26.657997_6_plen_74_part_00